MHRRLVPRRHEFVYRIFLFWLDLDELAEVAGRVPIFGFNEPNLYSLRESDHYSLGGAGLRGTVEAFLRENGETRRPDRIRMLTLPRVVGYVFNPITIFYCYGADGAAFASVIQVGNTFRELKLYFVPAGGVGMARRVVKHFYVSPFADLELEFDFRFAVPGDRLGVWIDDYRGVEKELVTSMTGVRVELTTANLVGMTVKYPLVTLQVIGGIHWEAVKLWWKGVPVRMKEADVELQREVFRPHGSLRGEGSSTDGHGETRME
jgi:hypothetical protein